MTLLGVERGRQRACYGKFLESEATNCIGNLRYARTMPFEHPPVRLKSDCGPNIWPQDCVNIRRIGGIHSRQTVGSPAVRPDPRFGKRGYHTFAECLQDCRRKSLTRKDL